MYIPSSFAETDPSALGAWLRAHPLGLLVTGGAAGLYASSLPFVFREGEGGQRLAAHLARANLHWQRLRVEPECLVVFQGADGYVTPDWYPGKATTHREVPTWNYELVQVRGRPRVIEDPAWLRRQIGELTDQMEAPRPRPWQVADAPADYIDTELKALVGVEIEVLELRGKFKLSQNRTVADARAVVAGMSNPDDPHHHEALAALIDERALHPRAE
jgi:transcriptional regulator